MEPLTILLNSMIVLVTLNSVAIMVTIYVGFKGSQVDEAKRLYWQTKLEKLTSGEDETSQ